MKIAIVGTGYVGLVAGACFAEAGTEVVCVDIDEKKLERLRQGHVPFFEPGLDAMVTRNWPTRLQFTTNLAEAMQGSSAVFIAVGTPPNEDGSADLSYVLGVAKDIATTTTQDTIIVLKSTVPVGTNAKVRQVVDQYAKHKISVVSNPEFLKEGDALSDFLKPDRIVIGTEDDAAFAVLERLYAPFNRQRRRLHRMSPKSAEIVKYAANALLATKISFMNEIAALCDAASADVEHVRLALGADHRIGLEFLYPGLGFGGSCFPKDLRALVSTGEDHGLQMRVAQSAVEANKEPVARLIAHMQEDLGSLSGKKIGVWGVAFKPKTDDVREAPALELIARLLELGASVVAADPEAVETGTASLKARGMADKVKLCVDPYEAAKDADAVVLATEWQHFCTPDARKLKAVMRGDAVFDGRNAMSKEELVEAGLRYRGMGRR